MSFTYGESVYDKPEKYGLTLFRELDSGAAYEFDMLVVWEDQDTGQLYYARDSGCSCPSPFQDYNSVDSLIAVHEHNLANFIEDAHDWAYYSFQGQEKEEYQGAGVDVVRLQSLVTLRVLGTK